MISFSALVFASVTFLFNPPATCQWAYAELQPLGEFDARTGECEASRVAVLSTTSFQVVVDELEGEDLKRYDALVRLIEHDYPDGSRSDRMRMVGDLRALGPRRLVDQVWVSIDSFLVRYTTIIDLKYGGSVVTVRDEITGQYLTFLNDPKDSSDFFELMEEFLDSDQSGEKREVLKNRVLEDRKGRIIQFDVNGAILYLDGSAPDTMDRFQEGFASLWAELPDAEGKRRIEMAIAVILRAAEDEGVFDGMRLKRPVAEGQIPLDDCLVRGRSFVNGQKGGGLLQLEGPPEEILNEFFGKKGFPLPRPDWSFKKVVRELF